MKIAISERAITSQKCFKCGENKLFSDFHKHPTGRYGVSTTCKVCKSFYRRQHYLNNFEKSAEQSAKWSKENLHKKRAYRANRRAKIVLATPKWADLKKIEKIYAEASFLSKVTGIKYEVDHVIPLVGKNVCGLHVYNNLEIITMKSNREKAAKYQG